MRYFSLFTLLTSTTFFLSADEYTIQLIVAKNQKSIDTVRKMVAPCKVVWHSYVDSKGRNVLTCGRYDSMAAAKKDIALTRKVVPDAFVSTLRVSKKPILKKEQKSAKVQVIKETLATQKVKKVQDAPAIKETQVAKKVEKASVALEVKDKPKVEEVQKEQKSAEIKESPKVQEIKVVPKTQEVEDTPAMQPEMEEAPLRLINITPDAPIPGQSQKEEEAVEAK